MAKVRQRVMTEWPAEKYHEAVRLQQEGYTQYRIHRLTGVPTGTLAAWLSGRVPKRFRLNGQTDQPIEQTGGATNQIQDDDSVLEQIGEAVIAALQRAIEGRDQARQEAEALREQMRLQETRHDWERKEWSDENKLLTEERNRLADELNSMLIKPRRFTSNEIRNLISKA